MNDFRPPRRALSNLGGPVETQGDPSLTALLAQAFQDAAAEDPDVDTHGFHTYPARMHPAIPRRLLQGLARPHDLVLDPFCGSGTTLVEARAHGLRATGVDLNPIALRVTAVKAMTPNEAWLAEFQKNTDAVARASEERVKARARSHAPLSPDDVKRYDGHVLRELAGLLEEIAAVKHPETRRVLAMVFSAIVVKFSRQRADTAEGAGEKKIGRYVPTRFFERKAEELCARWSSYQQRVPVGTPAPKLAEGDARALSEVLRGDPRYHLVISSPPYGGTYDYHGHHRLRLAWLGLEERAFFEHELGARRHLSRAPQAKRRWDDEVQAFLQSLRTKVDADGLIVLLMGDGEVDHVRVPADVQLRALAPSASLEVIATASEERTDWRGGTKRREHLIALRPKR